MIVLLLLSGLVIGSNNLAAALTIGALGGKRNMFKIITVFGVFEFTMPLIGIWMGEEISVFVGQIATLLSVLILLGLAIVSFYSASQPAKEDERLLKKITSWKGIILLELGLSLDNLVTGFGLGIKEGQLPHFVFALTIAVFSIMYTIIGLNIGDKLARKWENYTQFGVGALLVLLASLIGFGVL